MNVKLNIDQLVLHGFEHLDRGMIEASLKRELHRLISKHGVFDIGQQNRTTNFVDAGALTLDSRVPASAVGRRLAASVYRGIKQ